MDFRKVTPYSINFIVASILIVYLVVFEAMVFRSQAPHL